MTRAETRRLGVLIRHFLGRFFRSPLSSGDGDLSVVVAELVAPVAVVGALACLLSLQHRFFLSFIGDRVDPSWLWVNECFHLSLAMIFTGLITLLQWDELLLDEDDFANLGCLPIRPATIFLAKAASLLLFVGLVSLGANLFSAVLFPGLLSTGEGFVSGLGWLAVHWSMLFFACLTVFFGCLAVRGLLLLTPGQRLPQAASLVSRWVLMVAMLTGLVALPQIHAALPQLKASAGEALWLFPPMWFVGLYQTVMGRADPVFGELARIALLAMTVGLLATGGVFAFQYRRHVEGWVRSWSGSGAVGATAGGGKLSTLFLRDPTERAVFHFAARTLFRSQRHLLIWSAFSGLGVALFAASWGKLQWDQGSQPMDGPTWLNLSLVHLPLFFSLAGLRVVFSLPARLEANWIFRASETSIAPPSRRAARKAAFLFGALPWIPPALALHVGQWGWLAFAHCAYASILAFILIEALYFKFHKIPFACSFAPENVNLRLKLPIYFAGFALYVYGGSVLEAMLLTSTGFGFALGWLIPPATALTVRLFARRANLQAPDDEVVFDETSQPAVIRIRLN